MRRYLAIHVALTECADARYLTLTAVRVHISDESSIRELSLPTLRVLGQRTLVQHETILRLVILSIHDCSSVALTTAHRTLQIRRAIVLKGLIVRILAS